MVFCSARENVLHVYMGQNAKVVHLHQGDSTGNVRSLPHFWVATWYSEVECWPFVSEMYILIHSDIICIKLASENHVTTQKHGNGRTLPWHMHEERPIIWKNKNFIFFADAFWRRVPCAYFLWFLGPILSIFDNFWHKIIRTKYPKSICHVPSVTFVTSTGTATDLFRSTTLTTWNTPTNKLSTEQILRRFLQYSKWKLV